MDILTDIIKRCHKRHAEKDKLRQRQTVVTPQLYHVRPYHFKVHCARATPIFMHELERADISFMPIGHAPDNDHGPRNFGGDRFNRCQGINDWHSKSLNASWGIQIYTGTPSAQKDAPWHDIYFTYLAISNHPDAIYNCIEALMKMTATPLVVLTKSGGLRFSFRITEYLHPHTDSDKYYIYKHTPNADNPLHRDVYLQIRGDKGYSKWDGRYEILVGDLLNPPIITKELLFAPIDTLRSRIHAPSAEPYPEIIPGSARRVPSTLGSENLDLAKEALLKRGFSYLQTENEIHYWIRHVSNGRGTLLSLWEDRDVVWVRAAENNTEFPTTATPITDVLQDTGITPTSLVNGLPVNDKIHAVQDRNLSPLAVKRPSPVLNLKDIPKKTYQSTEEKAAKLSDLFNRQIRILGFESQTQPWTDTEAQPYFRKEIPICINLADRVQIESDEKQLREFNIPSLMRWKARKHQWEQVKDIPIEERMANPFQHGNVCENPELCRTVEQKGGDPHEIVCPKCPAFKACQERGYLSQLQPFYSATIQMSQNYQHFIDPRRGIGFKHILHDTEENERIYILYQNKAEINNLFLERRLPKSLFEQWIENWNGHALANFAKALLNALEPESELNNNGIGQIRAVIQAFKPHADELIKQMCYLNIRNMTKNNLDSRDSSVGGNSDSRPPIKRNVMRLEEMVSAGMLDIETVEKIEEFPTVSRDPEWTYWHELQHFFDHYKRDSDVPMRWSGTELLFWLPPIIHPTIRHLLIVCPTLPAHHLPKVFPTEEIAVVRTKPKPWLPENEVFQIRTDIRSVNALYNYDDIWNDIGASKIAERLFLGIRTEIERDTNIKHLIITNGAILRRLEALNEKENVCDVTRFSTLHRSEVDFQDAHVFWLIGMPYMAQRVLWWNTQMLFGNDDIPLNYHGDFETGEFMDERLQSMYDQRVVNVITQIVSQIGLDRETGKKVILFTNTPLPDITDRPETQLFDWEDFEIAGGLDKLSEVISTRERFEAERDKLTAETPREEVERIMGCSPRHANYILKKIRGGNIQRVSLREQILFLLSTGEKRTSVLVSAINSSPQAIGNELKRLLDADEIVRVQRGIYSLFDTRDRIV